MRKLCTNKKRCTDKVPSNGLILCHENVADHSLHTLNVALEFQGRSKRVLGVWYDFFDAETNIYNTKRFKEISELEQRSVTSTV